MTATAPIPVLLQGLGPIGVEILRAASADPRFRVVAGVDVAPSLLDRRLAELAPGGPSGITVQRSVGDALRTVKHAGAPAPLIVLQATGSRLPDVAASIEEAIERGLSVVSTCEELAWPFERHAALSVRLDEQARRSGVAVVGAGVNPGFVMDHLVLAACAGSHSIRRVTVERRVDPRARRQQFQRKVGLGLDRIEFEALAAEGRIGHVGLAESARLVAAGLGWEVTRWEERVAPRLPEGDGPVLGVVQTLDGSTADGRTIALRFEAHADVDRSSDAIDIEGEPPVQIRIDGGVFGDRATAAAILRAALVVDRAPRGLVTVLDLPLAPARTRA